MSDWVEPLTLEQAIRQAHFVCLADWPGGAREVREFEYRGQRFELEYRVFTVVEDLKPGSSGMTVAGVSKSSPVLRSLRSSEDRVPDLEPGVRIRVYDEDALDYRQDCIDETIAGSSRVTYRPAREVTEGRVILLLGPYRVPYEAFGGCAGWGILPPELLAEVREKLASNP